MLDISASPSIGICEAFFKTLENRDEVACGLLFTDDITETVPFNASGKSEPQAVFNGKKEVLGYVHQILTNFKQTRMRDQVFTASSDGSTVFCEAHGDLIAAKDSTPYNNVYVYRFDLKDGRICQIKEYANPVTYAQKMGLPIG